MATTRTTLILDDEAAAALAALTALHTTQTAAVKRALVAEARRERSLAPLLSLLDDFEFTEAEVADADQWVRENTEGQDVIYRTHTVNDDGNIYHEYTCDCGATEFAFVSFDDAVAAARRHHCGGK